MTNPEELRRENAIVLDAVQALLGMISSNVIAVAVRVDDERVELSFWVHRHDVEMEEDATEVVSELDALSGEHPLITYRICVGAPDAGQLGGYGRMVYWAKG